MARWWLSWSADSFTSNQDLSLYYVRQKCEANKRRDEASNLAALQVFVLAHSVQQLFIHLDDSYAIGVLSVVSAGTILKHQQFKQLTVHFVPVVPVSTVLLELSYGQRMLAILSWIV